MACTVVVANGVELSYEVRGPADGSAVVLIADADSPKACWTPLLLDTLAGAGYRTVTFDHRDTGASSRCIAGSGYDLADMANDAATLIDRLEVDTAHVLGRGMGGTIALHLVLARPELVRSLTLIGATPGRDDETLPDPAAELVLAMAHRHASRPPTSRLDRVQWLVEKSSLFAGARYPFDEESEVAVAAAIVDGNWVEQSGHGSAVASTPTLLAQLDRIDTPTLIIHGDVDPVFPVGHGEALERGLKGGRLLSIAGLGHEFPDGAVTEFGSELMDHLRDCEPASGR